MRNQKSIMRNFTLVTQLGLSVVTPIFLCIFAGYYIDLHFGMKTMVAFVILGTLSGGRCAYLMAKKSLESEQKDDEKNRQENQNKTDSPPVHKPKTPSKVRDAMRESQDGMEQEEEEEEFYV